jgi:ferrous iron transport protein A
MTLDQLEIGQRAEIASVDWDALAPDEGRRLRAIGLDQGARVAISHRGIFAGKDPIAVMVGRMSVAIRRVHARAMTVELV